MEKENKLRELIYTFYPKNICISKEYDKYCCSQEFIHLTNTLNNYEKRKEIDLIFENLKNHPFFDSINEYTSFGLGHSFLFIHEILIEKNTLIRFNIEMSALAPYYCVYITENKIKTTGIGCLTLPKRSKSLEEKYSIEIDYVSTLIEKNLEYKKFSETLHYKVIPDISFANMPFGHFTFYNAFFRSDANIPL